MAAWLGPAIKGTFGLLGGILGRSSARRDARRAEQRADPANIRKRFEEAGFNPLLGIGGAVPNPGLSSYQVSNEILMNSLAAAGDGFGEAATLRMQNTQQEREKQRLENLVKEATLGASIGGIYQGGSDARTPARTSTRSGGGSLPGGGNSGGGAGGVREGGQRPLLTPTPPGEEFEPGVFGVPEGTDTRLPGGFVMQTESPGWDVQTDPRITQTHEGPLDQTLTMDDGTVRRFPVGFDLDEMLTGWLIQQHDRSFDGRTDDERTFPQNVVRHTFGGPDPDRLWRGTIRPAERLMEARNRDYWRGYGSMQGWQPY